ncbi:MAG: tetratricopeptide repeat protein [Gammaproteobacteria bacterium]
MAIDSLFSLAYYRLGISANWIPDYGIAQKAAEEALRHSARLSPPDLTLVESFFALQTAQSTRVIRLLRPYLDAYPDNVDAWFMYGEVLFHYNGLRGRPMAEARQPFERALGLDPDNSTLLIHLMEITANEGDFATFDSLLQRVEPGSEFELQWQSLRDFALGTPLDQDRRIVGLREAREDQLRLAIQKLAGYAPGGAAGVRSARLLLEPGRSRGEQRSGRLWMIQLQARAGRWEAVKAEIEALRPLDPNRAVQFHALYGALPFLSLSETELEGLRSEVIGWRPGGEDGGPFDPLYREYLIGLLSVRLGDTRTARTAMERLGAWTGSTAEAKVGRFLAHHINAHLARRSGRPREALRLLSEPAVELPELPQSELHHSPLIWHPYERFARAEMLLEEGREEEALAWYGVLMEGLSWLNLPYAPISHLRSAQIYEQLGRRADATHHYAEFVRYWKDCDPVLQPLVAEAQKRLASLTVSESGKLSAVQ